MKKIILVILLLLLVSCGRDNVDINEIDAGLKNLDVVLETFNIKNNEVDLLYKDDHKIYLSFKSTDDNQTLNKQVEDLMDILTDQHNYLHLNNGNISIDAYDYMSFEVYNDSHTIKLAQIANKNMYPIEVEGAKSLKLKQDIVLYIEER